MNFRICTINDLDAVLKLNDMRSRAFDQLKGDDYRNQYKYWMESFFLSEQAKGLFCFGSFDGETLVATMCANIRRVHPKFRWDHWRSNPSYPLSVRKNSILMNDLMSFSFETMFEKEQCTSAYTLYPSRMFRKYENIQKRFIGLENVCYEFELLERIRPREILNHWVQYSFNVKEPFENEMLVLEAKVKSNFLDKWKQASLSRNIAT